jgi:hypothetical protein
MVNQSGGATRFLDAANGTLIAGGRTHDRIQRSLRAAALDMFRREYFDLRLLVRVMAGETMRPGRNLAELNRVRLRPTGALSVGKIRSLLRRPVRRNRPGEIGFVFPFHGVV